MLADVARVGVGQGGVSGGPRSPGPTWPPRSTASSTASASPPQPSGSRPPNGLDLALGEARLLTPPELHHTPELFLPPGRHVALPAPRATRCTPPTAILEAEARLLDAGRETGAPTVGDRGRGAHSRSPGAGLSLDQAVAVEQIATSGRLLDRAGRAGRHRQVHHHGRPARRLGSRARARQSVIGLAPSAAAAEVLADELGIDTENTAKWLTEHRRQPARQAKLDRTPASFRPTRPSPPPVRPPSRRRLDQARKPRSTGWQLQAGQLVIVDEASLAGTFALDELVTAAADAGAKVLLVGDWAQLTAVDAGGMFRTLVADRDATPPS